MTVPGRLARPRSEKKASTLEIPCPLPANDPLAAKKSHKATSTMSLSVLESIRTRSVGWKRCSAKVEPPNQSFSVFSYIDRYASDKVSYVLRKNLVSEVIDVLLVTRLLAMRPPEKSAHTHEIYQTNV